MIKLELLEANFFITRFFVFLIEYKLEKKTTNLN
jgi:hypothetical protein